MSAMKPYVIRENVIIGAGRELSIGAIEWLSVEDVRLLPKGYVELALDSEVQVLARNRANNEFARFEEAVKAAKDAVQAAEFARVQAAERHDSSVREAEFRLNLAYEDLDIAESEHARKMSAFSKDPVSESTPQPAKRKPGRPKKLKAVRELGTVKIKRSTDLSDIATEIIVHSNNGATPKILAKTPTPG